MAMRRFTPVLFLPLLGWMSYVGSLPEEAPPTAVVAPITTVNTTSRAATAAPAPDGFRSPEAVSRTVAPIATLDGASQATLMDQLALRQLAEGTELPLDDAGWAALAAVAAHFQAVRQVHEASLATVKPQADGAWQLEVPTYPEFGDMLRARFYETLQVQLGASVTDLVLERIGRKLEGYFGGFGVSVQTLQFQADGPGPADYLVTRTITYWNEPTNAPTLTTRRETHLPAIEDPTGQRWSAFLALLKASS